MSPEPASAPARILVVDDDVPLRCLVREALEAMDFVVEEAKDGLEALALYKTTRPDLVLLDVLMPGLDGFATCTELRKLPGASNLPIVLLTGLDDVDSVRRAYEVGATDFINKPFNPLILSHRVLYILRAGHALRSFAESERSLASAQRVASIGSWEWSREGTFRGSEELCRIFCIGEAEMPLGREALDRRVHPDDLPGVKAALAEARRQGKALSFEYRILLDGGVERFVQEHVETTRDHGGVTPVDLIGTVQDVTALKTAERQIHLLAYYDALTGLANRVLFKDRLSQALSIARRHDQCLAVMFFDLDRFKRINDTLGHSAGDLLLKGVAERLRGAIRECDSCGRLGSAQSLSPQLGRMGGDEFTILLSSLVYVQEAAKVAQRILDALARPFSLEGRDVYTTASIGIAVYPGDGDDVETLLKHADAAMYGAKARSKNTYQFFSRSMNATAFERLAMENHLLRAIERDELVVHYQPKVRVGTGEVTGVEALVRWGHPELGLVKPDIFLEVAREAGFLSQIDRKVLLESCVQANAWASSGVQGASVAVNISNETFRQAQLPALVTEALHAARIDPGRLKLELTEDLIMDDIDEALRVLGQLKDCGVKLAIDDFGTGSSCLGRIKDLPIDEIKIDRSFVRDLGTHRRSAGIIKAIIAMAHSLEMSVIAEGVETLEQLEFLREQGCDEIQGYLISPPVPAEALAEMLRQRTPLLAVPAH